MLSLPVLMAAVYPRDGFVMEMMTAWTIQMRPQNSSVVCIIRCDYFHSSFDSHFNHYVYYCQEFNVRNGLTTYIEVNVG